MRTQHSLPTRSEGDNPERLPFLKKFAVIAYMMRILLLVDTDLAGGETDEAEGVLPLRQSRPTSRRDKMSGKLHLKAAMSAGRRIGKLCT